MHPERPRHFERSGLLAVSVAMVLASLSFRAPSVGIFVEVRIRGAECVVAIHPRASFHLRLRCASDAAVS
jgi:hypothetical protein